MARDTIIRESDLIQNDGTIDELINKLMGLNSILLDIQKTVQNSSSGLKQSVDKINVVSESSKGILDTAAIASERLSRAYRELEIASSGIGREIAEVKTQVSDTNKASVENYREMMALSGSYNELKLNLKKCKDEYERLSEEERENADIGGVLLDRITAYAQKIKELNDRMKPHISQLNSMATAQKRVSDEQVRESKLLDDVRKKTEKLANARRANSETAKRMGLSEKQLANGMYEVTFENQKINLTLEEYTKYLKYTVRANEAATNSYKQISNEQSALTVLWKAAENGTNQMSTATVALTTKCKELRNQLQRMQEATGNYTLNVGNYRSAWDGLGMSVNQIVRELPSMAMSLNTFFVAISNNIPIFVDEVNKLRRTNKILQAQGKETISIGKGIIKALFSWNTAIVLIVTTLSMFGKEIFQAIGKMFKFRDAVYSTEDAMKELGKEIETNNSDYGKQMTLYKRLQDMYRDNSSLSDRQSFLDKYIDKIHELDDSINDVNDSDLFFSTEGEDSFRESLKRRAEAMATYNLIAKKYNEMLNLEEDLQEAERGKQFDTYKKGGFFRTIATSYKMHRAYTKSNKIPKEIEAKQNEIDYFTEKLNGYDEDLLDDKKKSTVKKLKNIYSQIAKMRLDTEKKYQDSVIEMQEDGYAKQIRSLRTANEEKNDELMKTFNQNMEWLRGSGREYEKLSEEEINSLLDANQEILATIENNDKALRDKIYRLETQQRIKSLQAYETGLNIKIDAEKEGSKRIRELRVESIKTQMDIEIKENSLKVKEEQQDELDIRRKYQNKLLDAETEFSIEDIEVLKNRLETRLKIVREGTQDEINIQMKLIELEKQKALLEDSLLSKDKQKGKDDIEKEYQKKLNITAGQFELDRFKARQKNIYDEFNIERRSTYAINKLKLEQEKELIDKKIALYKDNKLNLTPEEYENLLIRRKRISRDEKENKNDFTPHGIMSKLGFDDEAIGAMDDYFNYIKESITEIFKLEEELREKQVEAAKERTEEAKSYFEMEVEARNNGYANNVETAKKELLLAKKNQKEKEELLKKAQQNTAKIDTMIQVSSLVTATAEIWKSLAGIAIVGPFLAAAAIGTMWASFSVAKVKARQVASQEYGKGGLEFMEGGSHASGNDIDLGVKNKRGKRMKVEGGEAVAVINKRATSKYHKILPDIIKSINSGLYEENLMKRLPSVQPNIMVANNSNIDLSKLEKEVESIKKQNETKCYMLGNGTVVEVNKNSTRTIHN